MRIRPIVRVGRVLRLTLALVLVVLAQAAEASSKVALVIGNSAYRAVPVLRNPSNDAGDVAESFERLGFSVFRVTDATYEQMRQALLSFSRAAHEADMAVVFYAGHGIEVGGENWLIPIDAELRNDVEIEHEAVGLKGVMAAVQQAARLSLVILDACRNNPFAARMKRGVRVRAVSRGLAQVEPTGNMLVAYAAKDGTTAADGVGRNSPFTAALLKHVETPGLEINFLFRTVRDDVMRATNRAQHPFVYGSLSKDAIYLKPAPAAPAEGTALRADPPADEVAWAFLKDSKNPEAIRRFIEQFPASGLRAQAEARLATLAPGPDPAPPAARTPAFEIAYWNSIKTSTNAAAFESYLKAYPDGAFASIARLHVEELKHKAEKPSERSAPASRERKQKAPRVATRSAGTERAAPSSTQSGSSGGLTRAPYPFACNRGDRTLCRANCAAGWQRACNFIARNKW